MAGRSDEVVVKPTATPAEVDGNTAAGARKAITNVLLGASAIEMTPLLAVAAAMITPLLAFVTLWLFAVFPWLRPWTPPEERGVSISNAVVAERRLTLPDDREEVTVVTFDAEAIGYAADPITVATLWIDPLTSMRVEPALELHGNLVSSARTNRSIGWLNVPYPKLRDGVQGCLILRVFLLLAPKGGELSNELQIVEPTDRMPLLAYTDTAPFEPYEDGSCQELDRVATPSPEES